MIFAGVVLVLIALAVRWVVGGALRPVARMTADAEAWSELDLDRRFNAGEPHDEITLELTDSRGMCEITGLCASLRRFSSAFATKTARQMSRAKSFTRIPGG